MMLPGSKKRHYAFFDYTTAGFNSIDLVPNG